jgi:hypothetical protein
MMAAIQLGPRGKSEMALRQVFKCWQVELNSTAEALSFAVAKAEATTKGDK